MQHGIFKLKKAERFQIFDSFIFEKIKDLAETDMSKVFLIKNVKSNELLVAKAALVTGQINSIQYENKKFIDKEARVLLTLPPHTNIVNCFLVERIGGRLHVFMEYIEEGYFGGLDQERSGIH